MLRTAIGDFIEPASLIGDSGETWFYFYGR